MAENPGNITSWLTDHAGNIRGAQTSDGVNTSFLYRDGASGPFKTVLTTSFRDAFSPLFFTFDNKLLYAASNLGRDKQAIVLVDPATAERAEAPVRALRTSTSKASAYLAQAQGAHRDRATSPGSRSGSFLDAQRPRALPRAAKNSFPATSSGSRA